MSLVISDRVKETTTTQGTGTVTLGGPLGGFQSFSSAVGSGNTTYYVIENDTQFEIGIGTCSGDSLSRDTVLRSSSGGSKISLSGVSFVFCAIPADRSMFKDADGNFVISGDISIDDLFADGNIVSKGDIHASGDISTDGNISSVDISAGSLTITDLTASGNVVANDVIASGQILSSGLLTLARTNAGSFVHAIVDDNNQIITLHTDGNTSPEWKLGLKTNPSETAAPTVAYIVAKDGDIGFYANSSNHLDLDHGQGFVVTNKGDTTFVSSSATGNYAIGNTAAYPSFVVKAAVSQADNIQEWQNSSEITLANVSSDGSIQTSGSISASGGILFNDLVPNSITNKLYNDGGTLKFSGSSLGGDAKNTDVLANSASGVAISGYIDHVAGSGSDLTISSGNANLALISANTTEMRAADEANAASGVSISGWADSTFLTSAPNANDVEANSASGVAISGWASHTIDATGLYVRGLTLDNTTEIRSNSASGVAISGWSAYKVDANASLISDNTINISVSGNRIETRLEADIRANSASGSLHAADILSNSASGAAISGYNAAYTDIKVAALVGGAPATLDTLNEIAAAINDDANIATTLTNSISANTTEIRANSVSGVVNAADILANSASGVVISGIAEAASPTGTPSGVAFFADDGVLVDDSELTFNSGTNTLRTDYLSAGRIELSGVSSAGPRVWKITQNTYGSLGFNYENNEKVRIYGPTDQNGGLFIESTASFGIGASTNTPDAKLFRDAPYTFGMRNKANPFSLNIYNSNDNGDSTGYERLAIKASGGNYYLRSEYGSTSGDPGSLYVQNDSPSVPNLIVQGAAAQSANLQEWQNNAGIVLASVSSDGSIASSGNIYPSTFNQNIGIHNTNVWENIYGKHLHALDITLSGVSAAFWKIKQSGGSLYFDYNGDDKLRWRQGTSFTLEGNDSFAMGNTTNVADVHLYRDAAGIWGQRNEHNSQQYNLYNWHDDSSNYERLELGHDGQFAFMNTAADGSGTLQRVQVRYGGNARFQGDSYGSYLFQATSSQYIVYGNHQFRPQSDNTTSLGRDGNRWSDIYGYDLNTEASAATEIAATIKGAAVQSANLTEWQNNAGIVLASVSADGSTTASGDVNASGNLVTNGQIRLGGGTGPYIKSSTFHGYLMGNDDSGAIRWNRNDIMTFKNIGPNTGNLYNIGSSTLSYKNLYLGTSLHSSGVQTSGMLLHSHVPTDTTSQLYNDGGTLMFNGSAVGVSGVASGVAFFGEDGLITDNSTFVFSSGDPLLKIRVSGDATNNIEWRIGDDPNGSSEAYHILLGPNGTANIINRADIGIGGSNPIYHRYRKDSATLQSIINGNTRLSLGMSSSTLYTDLYPNSTADSHDLGKSNYIWGQVYGGKLISDIQNTTDVGVTVKGASAQSANLQEWTDNADKVLSHIDKSGVYTQILGSSGTDVSRLFFGEDTRHATSNDGYVTGVWLDFEDGSEFLDGGLIFGTWYNTSKSARSYIQIEKDLFRVEIGNGLRLTTNATATRVNGNLEPYSSSSNNLGKPTLAWRNVYGQNFYVSGILYASGDPGTNGQVLTSTADGIEWRDANTLAGLSGTPSGVAFFGGDGLLTDNTGFIIASGDGNIPTRVAINGTTSDIDSINDPIFAVYNNRDLLQSKITIKNNARGNSTLDIIATSGSRSAGMKVTVASNDWYVGQWSNSMAGLGGRFIVASYDLDTSRSIIMDTNGKLVFGSVSPEAKLHVNNTNYVNDTVSIFRGMAAQAGNLTEWQDSAGTVLASVTPDGSIASSGNISASGDISASGNIGIGTSSPLAKLDILGTPDSDYATASALSLTGKTGTGTNWSGTNVETGYAHTDGSSDPLVTNITPVAGQKYLITFTISGYSAGRFNHVDFGGTRSSIYKTSNGTVTTSLKTVNTDPLELVPQGDFVGTVSIDSVKAIGTRDAVVSIRNSAGLTVNQIRTGHNSNSIYIGVEAGHSQPEGIGNNGNTAIGYRALKGNLQGAYNTVVGWRGLENAFNCNYVTSVGHNIFQELVSPGNKYNTAMGTNIGSSTFTGGSNVLLGNNILKQAATSAGNNVAMGYSTMQYATTGGNNISLGTLSLQRNTTGSKNIALGPYAGRYYGSTADLTVTNNSIFIGYNTKASGDSQTNQVVIGCEAIGNGSNSVTLGNTSITKTVLNGDVGIDTISPEAKLHAVATSATDVGVIVEGAASQSANLQEWQNNAGIVFASVAADGSIASSGDISTSGNITASGNIGIGNSNPTDRLVVAGNLKTTHIGYTTDAFRVTHNSNDTYLSLYKRSDQSNAAVKIITAGESVFNGGNVYFGYDVNASGSIATSGNITASGNATIDGNLTLGSSGVLIASGISVSGVNAVSGEFTGTVSAMGIVVSGHPLSTSAPTINISGGSSSAEQERIIFQHSNGLDGCRISTMGSHSQGMIIDVGYKDYSSYDFFKIRANAQDATPDDRFSINRQGNIQIGEDHDQNYNDSQVILSTRSASKSVLHVKGAASQSANLQEWQDSTGTVLASVAADGSIASSGDISTSGNITASGNVTIDGNLTLGSSGIASASGISVGVSGLRFSDGTTQTTAGGGSSLTAGSGITIQDNTINVFGDKGQLNELKLVEDSNIAPLNVVVDGVITASVNRYGDFTNNQLDTNNRCNAFGSGAKVYGTYATSVGVNANASGTNSPTAIGGYSKAYGTANVSIGYFAGQNIDTSTVSDIYSVRVGASAGRYGVDTERVTMVGGMFCGYYSSGDYLSFFGSYAGYKASGDNNVGIGANALREVVGTGNVEIRRKDSFTSSDIGTANSKLNIDTLIRGDFDEGKAGINNADFSFDGAFNVRTGASTRKGLVVQGVASQSANLQEWQNSSSVVSAEIDHQGQFSTSGNITTASGDIICLDGKIGVGTDSPSVALEVAGGHMRMTTDYSIEWGGSNNRIRGNSGGATSGKIRIYAGADVVGHFGGASAGGTGGLLVGGDQETDYKFEVLGSGAMTGMASSGNVVIDGNVTLGSSGTLISSGISVSGINLGNHVPVNTANALYNEGGTLKFNGSAVGGGGGGDGSAADILANSASGVNHAADIIRNAASGTAALAELRIESASGTQAFAEFRSGFAASGLTYANGADNRVATFTDTNALNGEANLTFDGSTLAVNGAFTATTKSFLIDHPTKEGMKLQYASLEGPENGVYVRGTTNQNTIHLPEYWSELVDKDTITVNLTPIGVYQNLFIEEKGDSYIKVGGVGIHTTYDYVVYGERKDVEKLKVEW